MMITFPPTILKAEWTAVSDWIYIFHLLNSCFVHALRLTVHVLIKPTTSFLVKPKQSFILLSGIWDQSYIYTQALCGFKHFKDSVSWKVSPLFQSWEFQFILKSEGIRPSASSASVLAQECSQYWSPWAFSAQPLPLLKVGRWRKQGVRGCWLVFSFMFLQEKTWYNGERKVT